MHEPKSLRVRLRQCFSLWDFAVSINWGGPLCGCPGKEMPTMWGQMGSLSGPLIFGNYHFTGNFAQSLLVKTQDGPPSLAVQGRCLEDARGVPWIVE